MEDKEITVEDFLKDVEPEFNSFVSKLNKYEGSFKLMDLGDQGGYILMTNIDTLKLK